MIMFFGIILVVVTLHLKIDMEKCAHLNDFILSAVTVNIILR